MANQDKETLLALLWEEWERLTGEYNNPALTDEERETVAIECDETGKLLDELEFGGKN